MTNQSPVLSITAGETECTALFKQFFSDFFRSSPYSGSEFQDVGSTWQLQFLGQTTPRIKGFSTTVLCQNTFEQ